MNKNKVNWLIGIIIYSSLASYPAAAKMSLDGTPTRINCAPKLRCSLSLTSQFYLTESSSSRWTHNGELLPSALDMLAIIRDSYQDGLNPLDYHLNELTNLAAQIMAAKVASSSALNQVAVDPEILADFDVTLSDAFLLYAKHLVYGRIDNLHAYPDWAIRKRSLSLNYVLAAATHNNSVRQSLNALMPRYSGYALLKGKLKQYQLIAEEGGWESIPNTGLLKIGSKGRSVSLLQQRLSLDNESETKFNPQLGVFDSATRSALLNFQHKNNLKANGMLDTKTRQSLNRSVGERIKLIELNMDRLRWLPLEMGWRYLLVNIPDFSLVVIQENKSLLSMPVIIGKESNRSCILSSKISYLELNPYWTIPDSIAQKELLPKLQQNPNYLSKDQIHVYTSFAASGSQINPLKVNWQKIESVNLLYKFRQDPGPKNSLGQVKFIFPNDCGIYLHDTPNRNLFKQSRRDFSHGCIRIGKPIELANYLLVDKPNWSSTKIESQIASGKRQVVFLANPIDIHIIYATAWVDQEGILQFRNDVYNIDNVDFPVYLPKVGVLLE